MKILKKVIAILLMLQVFVLSYTKHIFARTYEITEALQAKPVFEYMEDIGIEYMDTVTFGRYCQSNENSKEGIEWLVIDKKDDKLLLLSKYILDKRCYDEKQAEKEWMFLEPPESPAPGWEDCSLRKWLNTEFLNEAFNDSEKEYIETTQFVTEDLGFGVGDKRSLEVNDKVFIIGEHTMSDLNLWKHLSTWALATNYAKRDDGNGKLRVNEAGWGYYENIRGYIPASSDTVGQSFYWKCKKYELGFITFGTRINLIPYWSEVGGVRPAIWVSIKN